jgi:hypothetical protein
MGFSPEKAALQRAEIQKRKTKAKGRFAAAFEG